MSSLTPAIKTRCDDTAYILRAGEEDVGIFDYIVYVGSFEQVQNYRVWYARANNCHKPEIITHDAFVIRPEE